MSPFYSEVSAAYNIQNLLLNYLFTLLKIKSEYTYIKTFLKLSLLVFWFLPQSVQTGHSPLLFSHFSQKLQAATAAATSMAVSGSSATPRLQYGQSQQL